MKLSPSAKRAARNARNESQVDMNLVALIDIFTILIFFLLSSASGVELLDIPRGVKLPASNAEAPTKQTVVVTVNADEILVQGRRVATVAEVMASNDDLIAPLQAELLAVSARTAKSADEASKVEHRVTIMGDKDIPYRLLRKVMVSAAGADFADVSFAVRRSYTS